MPDRDPNSEHSASTAQFRAFTDQYGELDSAPPWAMRAPRNQVVKLVAIVVGVALVLAVAAFLVIG